MRHLRVVRVFSIAAACATGLAAMPAWAGLGDDFGTRDPASCPVRSAPRTGGPSQSLMLRYLACDTERIGDMGEHIYLVGEAELEVAPKGRPFNPNTDANENVDTQQPVYDIHGYFKLYQCGRKSSSAWQANPGHACRFQEFFDANGSCWKDRSADWHCGMTYKFDITHTVHEAAPPP
jgi:hypothetical protein